MKQKLELRQLIKLIEEQKELEKECIENRKHNINKDYYMAKHDFRCIENMEDVIEEYEYIINRLNDLQDRVIERNKVSMYDL